MTNPNDTFTVVKWDGERKVYPSAQAYNELAEAQPDQNGTFTVVKWDGERKVYPSAQAYYEQAEAQASRNEKLFSRIVAVGSAIALSVLTVGFPL